MTATEGGNRNKRTLSGTIRRQIATPDNRRLLTRLPVFTLQPGPLPERFTALLAALDKAEAEPIAPENSSEG